MLPYEFELLRLTRLTQCDDLDDFSGAYYLFFGDKSLNFGNLAQ